MGNAKNLFAKPSAAITQQVVMHARALTMLSATVVGSLALSCVGISLLLVNIANQLDAGLGVHFTAGTYVYLAMTLVFASVLVWALRTDTWLTAVGLKVAQDSQPRRRGSPVEDAIALVVMDFLEERKQRRQSGGDS